MSNPIGDFFATMQSPETLQDLEDSVFGVDLDVCEAQDIMSLTAEVPDDAPEELRDAFGPARLQRLTTEVHQLWDSNEPRAALSLLGSNARLQFYASHYHELDLATQRDLVCDAWMGLNLLIGGARVSAETVLDMFASATRHGTGPVFDSPEARRAWKDLKASGELPWRRIILYRGDDPYCRRGGPSWNGPSWTTSETTASWFARTYGNGEVWRANLGGLEPYAVIWGRQEHEIVIDPYRLYTEPELIQGES